MFIFAGKTLNIYEMKPQDYEKIIMKNHHNASNQKAPDTFENGINIEVKNIAKLYKLAVGTDHLQRKETHCFKRSRRQLLQQTIMPLD